MSPMTALREDEFPMTDHVDPLPNILVVEESAETKQDWDKLNASHPELFIKSYQSLNMAMIEWMNLYAVDHIPRVLICSWDNPTESLGCLSKCSATGTQYDIDGPAFVLYCCMQSVGDSHGMFIAYSKDVKDITKDVSHWPQELRDRVHVINRVEYDCTALLAWIVRHDEFVSQLHEEAGRNAG